MKSKKVQGIFEKTFILALLSSAVFRLQNLVSFLLNCFVWDIKGFFQSSLGNEVDFRDMIVSPNILAKNENLKKLRHGFVDERALIKAI